MSRASTILCIDDEPQILSLRKAFLEAFGFRVLTAESGREGLRLLCEGHPVDLVLLDYVMPEMTGDRIAAELKRLYPHLPIVVMSGFPDVPEALLTITDGYVRKGQDPESVIGAITSALASKAQ
jgi:CheY-like chemotaxis protein